MGARKKPEPTTVDVTVTLPGVRVASLPRLKTALLRIVPFGASISVEPKEADPTVTPRRN